MVNQNNSARTRPNWMLKHNQLKIIPEIQRSMGKSQFQIISLFFLKHTGRVHDFMFIKLNIDFRNEILFCANFQGHCFLRKVVPLWMILKYESIWRNQTTSKVLPAWEWTSCTYGLKESTLYRFWKCWTRLWSTRFLWILMDTKNTYPKIQR